MTLPVSIIIPAKNEEKYLPVLLDSIKKQSAKPAEIIVADGSSTDNTVKIAKSFGCKIVDGGRHPGIGRNNAAKAAKQPYLIFFDADVVLPEGFIENCMKEFVDRKLGVASCFLIPDSTNIFDNVGFNAFNLFFYLMQNYVPFAHGVCIFARKDIHDKIGGFDENAVLAEDWDYSIRASKVAKYRFLNLSKIHFSLRRFRKEGRFRLGMKYGYLFSYFLIKRKVKKYIINYEFGEFDVPAVKKK
jgi:glycosyltransferase involved in cell wall biosynthesis